MSEPSEVCGAVYREGYGFKMTVDRCRLAAGHEEPHKGWNYSWYDRAKEEPRG